MRNAVVLAVSSVLVIGAVSFFAYQGVRHTFEGQAAPPATPVAAVDGAQLASEACATPEQTVESCNEFQNILNAIAEDNAKPDFYGTLGDFVVVKPDGNEDLANLPCDSHVVEDAQAVQQSQYHAELFRNDAIGSACPDGRIYGVFDYGWPVLIRTEFVGPLRLPLEAPRDRFRLLEVAGRPSLAMLQVAEVPVGGVQLAVIEKPSQGTAAGVYVFVHADGLEQAIQAAERLMGP